MVADNILKVFSCDVVDDVVSALVLHVHAPLLHTVEVVVVVDLGELHESRLTHPVMHTTHPCCGTGIHVRVGVWHTRHGRQRKEMN